MIVNNQMHKTVKNNVPRMTDLLADVRFYGGKTLEELEEDYLKISKARYIFSRVLYVSSPLIF